MGPEPTGLLLDGAGNTPAAAGHHGKRGVRHLENFAREGHHPAHRRLCPRPRPPCRSDRGTRHPELLHVLELITCIRPDLLQQAAEKPREIVDLLLLPARSPSGFASAEAGRDARYRSLPRMRSTLQTSYLNRTTFHRGK